MKLICRIEVKENRFPGPKHKLSKGIKVCEVSFVEKQYIPSRATNLEAIVTREKLDV